MVVVVQEPQVVQQEQTAEVAVVDTVKLDPVVKTQEVHGMKLLLVVFLPTPAVILLSTGEWFTVVSPEQCLTIALVN